VSEDTERPAQSAPPDPDPLQDLNVWAFIGPSGTGKSHRASLVAAERGIDLILDDGLLVMDGRILAGQSAKREDTMVGAVKRAILSDPEHARAVREALIAHPGRRLMILGTSRHMVERILKAIGLPNHPFEEIRIEEVASPGEIDLARLIRRQQGKHVIPAPTFEVRKTFSGYLVDPLRFMVRRHEQRQMVEKSVVRPTYSSLGRFYIADTVVAAIAARAARRVPGVARVTRSTMVTVADGIECHLELTLVLGVFIPDVLGAVQAAVQEQVGYQTALNVLAVHVTARRLQIEPAGVAGGG
jgi:uncharacterized alkaline shock family protein YloU